MRRYMRFLPIILAALALAASGSNIVLRNASAQLGATQTGGKQKVDGAMTLSVAAQRQISALLREKQSWTPEQRKISPHLIHAMRAQQGKAMTSDGTVPMLQSAMSIAKSAISASKTGGDGRVDVIIKANVSKQLLMNIGKIGGEVKSATAGAIRALLPLEMLETLAGDPAVKHISSAAL